MNQMIYENLFVFILAGASGAHLLKRLSTRVYKVALQIPLKCYLRVVAGFTRGKRIQFSACNYCGD